MGEESTTEVAPSSGGGDSTSKKRRRRRRRKRGGGNNASSSGKSADFSDSVLVADGGAVKTTKQNSKKWGRRQAIDISGPMISIPSSGRNPPKKRNSRARRTSPNSATARRRRLSRTEVETLQNWLARMPEHLLANLYRGLGGQPNRVANVERMIQLSVRAITQGTRIAGVIKQLHERDRKALATLVQCGAIAHNDEFIREMILSYGGHEREWKKSLTTLANKGLVVGAGETDRQFFYVIPEPLMDGLVQGLKDEMALPTFNHDDMRITDHFPFCPPIEFSITSLATYIDQNNPRLTQRQEIYRHDQEEMDGFFSQVWEPKSELFSFHLDFMMIHRMVELRGEYLSLNRDVLEEWLSLESEDQRDLMFRALDRHQSLQREGFEKAKAAAAKNVAGSAQPHLQG